jgi:hypothetical protein
MKACIYTLKKHNKFPLSPSTGETGQSSELEKFIQWLKKFSETKTLSDDIKIQKGKEGWIHVESCQKIRRSIQGQSQLINRGVL